MSRKRLAAWAAFVFVAALAFSLFNAGSPAAWPSKCGNPPGDQCTSGGCNCYIWCAVTESDLCMGHHYCDSSLLEGWHWDCDPICIPGPGNECIPN
jgi:hypothetical protein